MTYKAKQSTSEAASRDKIVVYLILALTIAIIAARVLFRLPDISQRPPQAALPADPAAQLPARAAELMAAHPGLSGVVPLVSGHDAFASRPALARMAERSIDAQYYIWHNDTSGQILLKTLYDAAQRGVRVRLLLDDNGVAMDETLAALNARKTSRSACSIRRRCARRSWPATPLTLCA